MKSVITLIFFCSTTLGCTADKNKIQLQNLQDIVKEIQDSVDKQQEELEYKQLNNPLSYEEYLDIQGKHLAHDKCFSCDYKWNKQTDPNLY